MEFRIADTFSDSLAKLTGDEQKAVKTTAFDLQMNPASPGMRLHKLDRAKDKDFWSVRVSSDIRLIVHKTDRSLMLCYVDHHDKAYAWAERRKLETHPKTGAAQLVEIRERVKEIVVPTYVEEATPTKTEAPLFSGVREDALLGYGVPPEWLADVQQATESSFFALVDHLPSEAAEALLELATGSTPTIAPTVQSGEDPFDHPDAQRRFRVLQNVEELERALDFPWEKWAVFLHPAQRDIVEREFKGPARVAGSAGTGKTVVALHRAVHLARKYSTARLLLTTFSETLAGFLREKVRRLASGEPGILERIEVHAFEEVGRRLYSRRFGEPVLIDNQELRHLLSNASNTSLEHRFSDRFLWSEWNEVVDAWQLDSWEAYRDVPRLGRKTRLAETQRRLLWEIFERVHSELASRKLVTLPRMFARLTQELLDKTASPYDFVVVDEAQDIGVAELRFLAALGKSRPDSLFFAGDLGQRIFQPPFSWKSLGIDVRGRSRTLRINYRTSHQIRVQADRLLPPEMSDVDGNKEQRRGTVSAFNGPAPEIRVFDSTEEESQAAGQWMNKITAAGVQPHEIGVFVHSKAQVDRARRAVESVGYAYLQPQEKARMKSGHVAIMPMHLAKGLEFRGVLVMACDDEIIPLQERITAVADDIDLEEIYNTERHLLYVACTRARDHLLVTGVNPVSEFLDDLGEE